MFKAHLLRIFSALLFLAWNFQTNAQTNPAPQSMPYSQDFSGLLHTSTTYPSGLQGWKVSSAATTSIVTTGPTADHSLIASASASTTAGGVNNYNGKIGFLSSGSTNPGIVLSIDAGTSANINVSYDIMVIRNPYDGGSNTRINESVLQYRIGEAGTWTTLAGVEYVSTTVNQTTAGVTTPQNPESRFIILPAACNNQAIVQIRWINHDQTGAGSRPSFAIDNIFVVQDNDNDGFISTIDCDDNNPASYPDATEICDGSDNNCDGNIDENLVTATISPVDSVITCKGVPLSFTTDECEGCTYQWFKNDHPIAGATSSSYSTTKFAHYSVEVSIPGGCSAVSDHTYLGVELNPNANIYSPNGLNICAPDPGPVVLLKVDYNAGYTYQWLLNGDPYLGAGADTYKIYPDATGEYRCSVTSASGVCSRLSDIRTVINSCKSGYENETEEISIYPNPSAGVFIIQLNSNIVSDKIVEVVIFDLLGAVVHQEIIHTAIGELNYAINLQSELAQGSYIIKVSSASSASTATLIVNK